MNKKYEVSWKITGKIEVAAENGELAEEIVNSIEDPAELVKHSILLESEAMGHFHIPWHDSPTV